MPNPQEQATEDMVTISLPATILDALLEVLSAAKEKASQDIQNQGRTEGEPNGLEGMGEEMAGSGRMMMQTVQR